MPTKPRPTELVGVTFFFSLVTDSQGFAKKNKSSAKSDEGPTFGQLVSPRSQKRVAHHAGAESTAVGFCVVTGS